MEKTAQNVVIAEKSAAQITANALPHAREQLEKARAKIKNVSPASNDYSRLSFELNKAEKNVRLLDRQRQRSRRSSDLNQWRNERAINRADNLDKTRATIENTLASSTQRTALRSETDQAHSEELKQAVNELLNSQQDTQPVRRQD